MHTYCLFCETQRCAVISYILENSFGVRAIMPRIIQRKWVKGSYTDIVRSWLPGYLFLYSEEPIVPYFSVSGILRWVGKEELQGQDRLFAEKLLRNGGLLGTVRLAQEGDRCRIDDPFWENLEGTILKVDRGRKRCCIGFRFDETDRTVWVGYELVKPENPEILLPE